VPSPFRFALLLAVVVALVAAGCGGSNSDKKANEAYADSVCTAVGTWKDQIQKIVTDFSGGISKASITKKVDQAQAATKTLVTEIKAVPPPDTDEGKAAKQQIDQVTHHMTGVVNTAKQSVAQLPDNATVQTIAGAVAALGPQVQGLVNEAKSAVSSVKDAGGSLADAFKKTDSCQSLTSA
jgi:gas vesicle protein